MGTYNFRVHTPNFLEEIANKAIRENSGVLYVPLNTFRILIAQVAERASKLNDPILNKLMFDLTLYELPNPKSKEYGELMKKVYKEAELQVIKESKLINPNKTKNDNHKNQKR